MASNYDNSAWFYDSLSRLVYGKALTNAQVYLLQFVPSNSKILIVGGGTGWILEELACIHKSGLEISYVEISAKMMALSKQRNTGNNMIHFVNKAAEDMPFTNEFDVVITPFLFDNFTPDTLQKVFVHLHSALKPGGVWLNTDFQLTGKWWQSALLKSMFTFFRVVCNIEASVLPDIEKQFSQNNFTEIAQQTFFGDFIVSGIYKKTEQFP